MAGPVPVLPTVVIAAGLVSAGFLWYLWPYRHHPGGWFFIGTIAAEAVWTLSYGVALLVFDPAWRPWFEIPIWVCTNFIGVFFLAFALEYTGRGDIVRSPWMAAIVALQVIHSAIVVTNPLHHIAWTNYQITPIFGAATVTYTHTLWLSINFAGIYLMVAGGAFLLFDTILSYGELYRFQAAAIALSPVLPGLAFLLWLFELGITPPLNVTPLTFSVHLGFIFYAFFRRNMFELSPVVRRASERTAIDDLGTAVIVVDGGERIINLNDETRRVFGLEDSSVLGDPLETILPGHDLSTLEGSLSLHTDGERREYAVSASPLRDATERAVGHTILLQDITAEKRREQRLAVLNRVLRHNLRNDLNVVQGYIELVREAVDDEQLAGHLAIAEDVTNDVIDLGEKARQIEEAGSPEMTPTAVPLADRLEPIATELRSAFPNGTVTIDVPGTVRILGTEDLVDAVFENLLENALEHNPTDDAWVEVSVVDEETGEETVTVEIRDNGPGISSYELAVLEAEEETPLEHGSGLGLWLVTWGVRIMGGTFDVATGDQGTTVRLTLPGARRPVDP